MGQPELGSTPELLESIEDEALLYKASQLGQISSGPTPGLSPIKARMGQPEQDLTSELSINYEGNYAISKFFKIEGVSQKDASSTNYSIVLQERYTL